jgi:MFS family permease
MVLAPLFPLATGFWALLFLQLVNGAAVSFAWSGAQTLIAQLAEGDAKHIGRFTFFARLGWTSAPIVAGPSGISAARGRLICSAPHGARY